MRRTASFIVGMRIRRILSMPVLAFLIIVLLPNDVPAEGIFNYWAYIKTTSRTPRQPLSPMNAVAHKPVWAPLSRQALQPDGVEPGTGATAVNELNEILSMPHNNGQTFHLLDTDKTLLQTEILVESFFNVFAKLDTATPSPFDAKATYAGMATGNLAGDASAPYGWDNFTLESSEELFFDLDSALGCSSTLGIVLIHQPVTCQQH